MFSRKSIPLVILVMSLLMAGTTLGNVLEINISDENNDVEERLDRANALDMGSSDLELAYEDTGMGDPQVVGVRFTGVSIPKGAIINNALIQFQVDEDKGGTDPVNVIIEGELAIDANAFADAAFNVTERARTAEQVSWSVPNWTNVGDRGPDQATPNLAAIIQEIVDQDGWVSGNSLALIISDDPANPSAGVRCAEGGPGDDSATLYVEYDVPVVFETRIADELDDVEEDLNPDKLGEIDSGSSDLELAFEDNDMVDPQLVGVRFRDVAIPPGTPIINAWVRFQVDETKSGSLPVNLIIEGQLDPNPPAFVGGGPGTFDISNRPRTAASLQWSVPNWENVGDSGAAQTTVNIAPIIDELINQPGWASGNAIVLIFSDDPANPSTGIRCAEGGPGDDSALLHIEALIDIATKPAPANGAEGVVIGSTLNWSPIPGGSSREVYFGTTSPPPLVSVQEATSYYPGPTEANTTYYWQVNEIEADGTTVHAGDLWSFTTGASNVRTDTVIASQNDDGEDHIAYEGTADDGAESRGSSDLEMPWDGGDYQVVGLRFTDMPILQGTPITEAYVQFTADNEKLDGGPVNLIISGLLLPDTGELGSGENFYTDRVPKTTAEVAWTDIPEWTSGQATEASMTPDISSIIQEIVNQDGWAPGNAIMLFIRDDEANPSASVRSALSGNAVLHVPVTVASATQPGPINGAEEIAIDTVLSWWPGFGAVSHDIYLSTDAVIDETDLVTTVEGLDYALADLTPGVTYFWRVDATDADQNTTAGEVWQFTVVAGEAAYGPSPVNGGVWQIGVDTDLSWKSGVGAMIHHVYFSDDKALVDARDPSVATQYWPVNTLAPGDITPGTTYYWAVDEFSGLATVAGPTWRFTALEAGASIVINDGDPLIIIVE